MKNETYFLIVKIIAWFNGNYTVLGSENLPAGGPAVFIANHLGPQGPVATVCSIPLRFYPWIIADQVDKNLAPEYLRIDFIEPELHLEPPLSLVAGKLLSLITVPMLSSMGCIPVSRGKYADVQDTLLESVKLLKEGKILLIFPEAPEGVLDPLTNMRPFLKGFTRLGELFYQDTGLLVNFFPIAIHESQQIAVGKSIRYNPKLSCGMERLTIKTQLENKIKEMYLALEAPENPLDYSYSLP